MKKMFLTALILLILIWTGFLIYKKYSLRDFNIQEASKTGRIISIRGYFYNIHFVNKYPILLMSDDQGKTWYKKNIRGIWHVFPLLEFLQLDNPIVDVISIDKTIYIVSRKRHALYDPFSGFFFSYKSNNDGKSWSSCFTLEPPIYDRSNHVYKPGLYSFYDNKTSTKHRLKLDPSEVIQGK